MRRARTAGLLLVPGLVLAGLATGLLLGAGGCPQADELAAVAPPEAAARSPLWAQPVERPGLPNLHKVTDGLYRGAQPTAEGMRELERMGIRTVLNLRSAHSDEDELAGTGLAYERIAMKAWHPEDEDVVRFLKIVTDPARLPVFVHCQHGADRTGTMCAAYRVVVQGWSKEDAVAEMVDGGFGFHDVWRPVLAEYLEDLDVAEIRRTAGLDAGLPEATLLHAQ